MCPKIFKQHVLWLQHCLLCCNGLLCHLLHGAHWGVNRGKLPINRNLTIVQSEDCCSPSKGTQELSDHIEGKLPELELAQDNHGERYGRVHVRPWDGGQSRQ